MKDNKKNKLESTATIAIGITIIIMVIAMVVAILFTAILG